MEAGDTATLATASTPATETPTLAPSETPAPSSSDNGSAAPAPVAVSRRTGQPITQEEVDQLYQIITTEVNDRTKFVHSLDRVRTPLGIVHHGIGNYAALCDDGTFWKSHGEGWEEVGKPIPGTRADLVAHLKADSEQRAKDAAAATSADNVGNHPVAG